MKETDNLDGAEESCASVHDAADATADEIRKAKELLQANGYCLVAYRETGEKVKRAVGSVLDFVKGKGKAFGGWLSAKRDELKARQEERNRATAEKIRLAEEAEKRRAEAETARGGAVSDSRADDSGDVPKCAACGAGLVPGARFCRKCGTPVSVARDASAAELPAESKSVSVSVDKSADSAASKCAACGAVLAAGMKFCGESGAPVHAETRKPRQRKTARPRKTSPSAEE